MLVAGSAVFTGGSEPPRRLRPEHPRDPRRRRGAPPAPHDKGDHTPAVVFDLDGTLVDSAPDIHAAVNRTLAAHGHPPLPLAAIKRFIGNGVPS